MKRSSYSILELAGGIALGIACGYMLFNRSFSGQVAKKLRNVKGAVKSRQTAWRDSASALLERGEEHLDHVREKGKRVYHELAS